MPHHIWNDTWFREHGETLQEAMIWIMDEVEKRSKGKASVSLKEKYGTVRYEHMRPADDLYHWIFLWKVVKDAVKIYPELEDELVSDIASMDEVVGEEIHSKYWRKLS